MPYIITLWGNKHDIKTCLTLEEAQAYVAESNARQGRPVDDDTLTIVEIDEILPCVFCGSHVTAKDWPTTDFCRSCYHAGRADEREFGQLLDGLRTLPNVQADSVGIWNSGGGCMILSMTLVDGRYLSSTCAVEYNGEWHVDGGLPYHGEPWGIVISPSEEAFDEMDGSEDFPVIIPVTTEEFPARVRELGQLVKENA